MSHYEIYPSDATNIQGSTFQGFGANVHSLTDVNRIIDSLRQSPKGKLATHHIVAYRLSSVKDDTPAESCMDDGENGAGGNLLRLLQNNNIQDTVIVVARWYGGKHIGQKRFSCITDAARQVLTAWVMRLITAKPNGQSQPPTS
jgi:putative IMPACT (imprinted ancient) family translation regulator